MTFADLHPWALSPREAIALQKELAGRIDVTRPFGRVRTVAGCDVSFNRRSPVLYAAVVVVRVPGFDVVEQVGARLEVTFPYVPGLLSFRELPPLLAAFRKLRSVPDVVMLDGQGLAHPRRFGLACHLGLWLNIPTEGCAKSRLVGTFDEPGPDPGHSTPLSDRGDVVGDVVRTRTRALPMFVSPGHRIDRAGALEVVRKTCDGYRIPVPTRLAHRAANAARVAGG